jgi:hypothetical protein
VASLAPPDPPAPPDSPVQALFSRAAGDPENPGLFHPEGLDWRWLSHRDLAGRVAARARELLGHPAGTRAAFLDRPRPETSILDLAIQAAGLVAVPVLDPAARAPGDLWLEAGELGALDSAALDGLPRPGGGVALGGRILSAAALAAAAGIVDREVRAAPPRRGPREILVSFRPLADPAERASIAWAWATGAALLLEPFVHALTSVAWARPTLFAGPAAEIRWLRTAAESAVAHRPWRRRALPFGRLRLLLVTGAESLDSREAAWWQERGTRIAPFPDPFPPAPGPPDPPAPVV